MEQGSGRHRLAQLRVLLHKWRNEPIEQSKRVVAHEHLPGAVSPRADANGRGIDLACDTRRKNRRNRFEHNRERARFRNRRRFGHQPLRVRLTAALHQVSA